MKKTDILAVCPDTGKRISFEICHSTFDTEPDQAIRDISEGADAVIVVCATRDDIAKLERAFTSKLGKNIDKRITLALPCHIKEAPSLQHVFECPSLVYDNKWDKTSKKSKRGR